MSQPTQKVDTTAFLGDVQAGLDNDELMARYGLSSSELEQVFDFMVSRGLLEQSLLDERFRLLFWTAMNAKQGVPPSSGEVGKNQRDSPDLLDSPDLQTSWYTALLRFPLDHRVAFTASCVLACVLVTLGLCWLVDRHPAEKGPSSPITANIGVTPSPSRAAPARARAHTPSLRSSIASLSPSGQIALGREILEGIVSERISGSELQAFQDFPEFSECQRCLTDCDRTSLGIDHRESRRGREECRRECLANCSGAARMLMNQYGGAGSF